MSLHTVALTQLSLENFYQSSQQQKEHTTVPSIEASIPVNYGRKPISEEEITFINVRHFICVPFFNIFYYTQLGGVS